MNHLPDPVRHARDTVTVLRWLLRLDSADLFAGALDLEAVRGSAVRLYDDALAMAPSEQANLCHAAVRERLQPRPLQAQCTTRDVQAACLIRARLALGLIQGTTDGTERDSVAHRAGVTQSIVSRCELGKAPFARMRQVGAALGVSDLVSAAAELGAELQAAGVAIVEEPEPFAHLKPAHLATLTALPTSTPTTAPAAPEVSP